MTYFILRKFFNGGPFVTLECKGTVIKGGLTLEAAQAHCSDPQTSSATCTTDEGKALTEDKGPWFDCYYPTDRKRTMFGLGKGLA